MTNTKTQVGYDQIFTNIKEIIGFGNKFHPKFETVTTDNETVLNNSLLKYFPDIQRIACYFHYKQTLERNAKKMGLCKKNLLQHTRLIIQKLGILPLIYNGNIDLITETIDDLKNKFPSHYHYLDSYLNENLKYYINNSLYYSKYPKLVRSNSILENYNKHLKEQLGKKKIVNFINFLSFIKKEDEHYFKEFNIKRSDYTEILKYKGKHKKNKSKDFDYQLDDSVNEDNIILI